MIDELKEWLVENFIDFKFDEAQEIVEISGVGKFFIFDSGEETVFDQDFELNLSAIETDSDELMDEGLENTIYKFGDMWYYTSNDCEKAEMNPLQSVGKAFLEMEDDFTHLGVHGHRELLNGSGQYDDYAKKAKFFGYKALGICEKNTLAGTLIFQSSCKKHGIKPILGMSIDYIVDEEKVGAKVYAKNEIGWKNILNISNIINNENLVEKAIESKDLLRFGEGIVFVFDKDNIPTQDSLSSYKDAFDDTYYQIDTTEYSSDKIDGHYLSKTKEYIDRFGRKGLLKPILLSDSYYVHNSDNVVKKYLNMIDIGATHLQSKEQSFRPYEYHFDKFEPLFKDGDLGFFDKIFDEAVENTMKVAIQCDFEISMDFLNMPEYELTNEEKTKYKDKYELFNAIVDSNWNDRVPVGMDDEYQDRLDEEFRVIDGNGFLDYFLINWDWLEYCRRSNIYVGVARGSAGGSVLSYLLGVTHIDPIKYNLLFERFLNEGRLKKTVKTKYVIATLGDGREIRIKESKLIYIIRELDNGYENLFINAEDLREGDKIENEFVNKIEYIVDEVVAAGSPPDIDSDVESSGRQQVKEYLEQRYGKNRVFSIGTFTSLGIKSAIGDVARMMGINTQVVKTVTKLVSQKEVNSGFGFSDFFAKAMESEMVKKFIFDYPELLEVVRVVMGNSKSPSIHAAGVVITPKYDKNGSLMNAWDWTPMKLHDDQMVSEWEGQWIEASGLLKLDLLGTTILDKIHTVVKSIKRETGEDVDFHDIYTNRLSDEKTYEIFQKGFTQNIFQFSGIKMTKFIQSMEPSCIDDIIAANALYRPATINLNYHEDYVEMKHGRKKVKYDWGMDEITKDTYGIMCLSRESNITTNSGIKKINNVSIGDMVVTETGEWKEVEDVLDQGVKQTYRIRTSFGEELVATADHKILTQRGWVEVQNLDIKKDIVKGQWMYPQSNNGFGTIKDWCVGLALADGYFGKGTPTIACSDEIFANKVKEIFDREFDLNCRVYFNVRTWYCQLSVVTGRSNGSFCKEFKANNFTNLLKSLDLFGKTKDKKFFPQNSTLMTAIGFIEGDGCVANGTIRLGYESMANGIFKLLQENKVHSSRYNNEAYCTGFDASDARLKFLIKRNLDRRTNNRVVVPRQYLLDQKHKLNGYHKKNHTSSALRRDLRFVSKTVCDNFGVDVEHVAWGLVLSVKEEVCERVYDLSVRDVHSFTSGGLVVHNCYQEQSMVVVQKIGGFSLQESDDVRKAMGKKKKDLMESYRVKFIDGAVKNGCDELDAIKIWNDIEQGAEYGFNRSHAAAYGLESYVTAYLKAHYPVHFYTMSLEFADDNTRPLIISEIYDDGRIEIASPNVNTSGKSFVTDYQNNKIYWALNSIKMVGDVATQNIVNIREADGEYSGIDDFIKRTKGHKVIKTTIINLILSGAFDEVEDLSSIVGRFQLIKKFYVDHLGENVPEDKFPSDQILKSFFWNRLQNSLSGLGSIDYRGVYNQSGLKDKFKSLAYLKPEDFNLDSKRDKFFGFAATLVDIRIMNSKKTNIEFAKLTLQCNDKVFTCMVWMEQWAELGDSLKKNKGSIIVLNGRLAEDEYSGGNQLYTHKKTAVKFF